METKTPKFDKSHMEMRFAQLLMALTQKLPVEGERDFHLLQYKEMFLKNYKNYRATENSPIKNCRISRKRCKRISICEYF